MRLAAPWFVALCAACQVGHVLDCDLPLDATFVTTASIDGTAIRLLLDTGCSGCVLDESFVLRSGLQLPSAGAAEVRDSTGAVRPTATVLLRGLRVGKNVYETGRAVVMAMPPGFPADGVLGMDALGGAAWCFDSRNGTVAMLRADTAESTLMGRGYRITDRLPLGEDALLPRVPLRLEGDTDVALLLDSGADSTQLPDELAASLALAPGEALARERAAAHEQAVVEDLRRQGLAGSARVEPDSGRRVGVHGVMETRPLLHLRSLDIGSARHEDLLVTFGPEGRLGRDVLARHVWVLHGPGRELWLLQRER